MAKGEKTGESDDRGRELWKVTCDDCGKESKVPFEPTEGKKVFCKECFPKHRKPRF